MLTRRAHLLTGLAAGVALTLWLNPSRGAHSEENTPVQNVVTYEDGSGVQYDGDREVRTFPADTFVWDCATMGNRVCGPLPVTPE